MYAHGGRPLAALTKQNQYRLYEAIDPDLTEAKNKCMRSRDLTALLSLLKNKTSDKAN